MGPVGLILGQRVKATPARTGLAFGDKLAQRSERSQCSSSCMSGETADQWQIAALAGARRAGPF